jgi:hypothetical protein
LQEGLVTTPYSVYASDASAAFLVIVCLVTACVVTVCDAPLMHYGCLLKKLAYAVVIAISSLFVFKQLLFPSNKTNKNRAA